MKTSTKLILFASASFLAFATAFAAPTTTAGSTSGPIPVAYSDSNGAMHQTSRGDLLPHANCYVTMGVLSVRVFAHTGLLATIFNTDAQVFATTKLSGKSGGGIAVSDTRVGTPRRLKSGDTIDDMGLQVLFLDAVPWNFSNLKLDLAINASADSTVSKIVAGVSDVSKSIPGFQLSAAVNGALSASQVFDKLLFEQQRSEAKLSGSFDLVVSGKNTLHQGCYVVFGGDSAVQYQKYLENDANGESQLAWTNGALSFKNQPVNDVSYFVFSVERQAALYPDADEAPLNSGRQWAAPLQDALLNIVALPLAMDEAAKTKAKEAIVAQLGKGQTLLLADPDILIGEKQAILKGVSGKYIAALATATTQAIATVDNATNNAGVIVGSQPQEIRGSKLFPKLYFNTASLFTAPVKEGAKLTSGQRFILSHASESQREVEAVLRSFAQP